MPRGLFPSPLPALLLLAASLAACTEAPAPDAGEAVADGGPALAGARPAALSLSGCSGWETHMEPLPAAAASWETPPGWEPPAGDLPKARMAGLECDRLGLGPFERPVRLVWDSHTHATFPDACHRAEVYEMTSLVGTVWIDDAEVARFLNETYGLPARAATVTPAMQGQTRTWTWGDAAGTSQVTFLPNPLGEPQDVPILLLWEQAGRIVSLGLQPDGRTGPVPTELPAFGTLAAPALLASMPGGAFASTAAWSSGFAAEGSFTFYRDLMCEEPEATA